MKQAVKDLMFLNGYSASSLQIRSIDPRKISSSGNLSNTYIFVSIFFV